MNKEIENKLNSLLSIDKSVKPEIIDFFKKDVATYIEHLGCIENEIKEGNVDPDKTQTLLNNATNQVVMRGFELENLLGHKSLSEKIKAVFRELIIRWMGQSLIMKRALEKPRGYPGDYETLEYVYNNKPVSEKIGYFFEKGFLESELCVAVRNRKDKMAQILKEFLNELSKANVLNLACGSCKEIKDIAQSSSFNSRVKFVCVDHDEMALGYAQKGLNDINATFVKEDIVRAVISGTKDLFKDKSLIYSIGLIDYLPDRILKKLIQLCYEGLEPGGRLIVSHKDRGKYIPIREDWLTDWKFVPRDEEKIINLVIEAGVPKENIELAREDSKIILFLIITKK